MSDKWKKSAQPPPPMFLGEKERDLVKQVNDEIIERVVGQQVLYFPIDIEHTNFHPLYGEAIQKTFLPPIRVFALVEYGGEETSFLSNIAVDAMEKITIKFHRRRLTEDQDLFVRQGDFVLYGERYYEIVKTSSSRKLFGQVNNTFEISATCKRARKGLFDAT